MKSATKPGEFVIRRNRIQWLEKMAVSATRDKNGPGFIEAVYCNLPRESLRIDERDHADAIAIDYAHKYPGDRFEVWNIETMRRLTVVLIERP